MTAQDKAKELLFKYRQLADWNNEYGSSEQQENIKNAKKCAVILCNEMIEEIKKIDPEQTAPFVTNWVEYWQQVKFQIQK